MVNDLERIPKPEKVPRMLGASGTLKTFGEKYLEPLFPSDPYSLGSEVKAPLLLDGLNALTARHYEKCEAYRRILDTIYGGLQKACTLSEVPYLPVGLFKKIELTSVPENDVFKVMHSSGTTSQVPSRITLDAHTAKLQTRALSNIMTHFLGQKRRPMILVDHRQVVTSREKFSARGAGILGMMTFGRDHFFALDANMRLDKDGLERWLEEHAGQELLVFGFTFMVWHYFFELLKDAGIDLSKAILFHSGGWKKVQAKAVTAKYFKDSLRESLKLAHVYDFYGMVEQTGSVFVECSEGYFHPPNFADMIVRDPKTWKPAPVGKRGIVEVLSLLPLSYPGHALLTEDMGIIHGVDDCPCGQKGKYFTISGRVPKAELRGCSDTLVRDQEN